MGLKLPTTAERKPITVDNLKITTLGYGETLSGKSTFYNEFPDPFFISTDGNIEGKLSAQSLTITSWEEWLEIVEELHKSKDKSPFKTLNVDVVNHLYDFCCDSYCKANKISSISESAFGKGNDTTIDMFIRSMKRFMELKSHFNINLIAHEISKEIVEKFKPVTKTYPAIWDKQQKMINTLCSYVDTICHFRKTEENKLELEFNQKGVVAGSRFPFPSSMPVDYNRFMTCIREGMEHVIKKAELDRQNDSKRELKSFNVTI